MIRTFKQFAEAATAAALTARDCGMCHWQVKGALLVNFYPDAGKVYVAGTKRGFRGDAQAAIAAANEPPKARGVRDTRRGKYRRARRRLLKKSTKCRWCGCPLTLDTSTLEHVVPLSRGGLDNENNMALACEPCNTKRGGDMPELEQAGCTA